MSINFTDWCLQNNRSHFFLSNGQKKFLVQVPRENFIETNKGRICGAIKRCFTFFWPPGLVEEGFIRFYPAAPQLLWDSASWKTSPSTDKYAQLSCNNSNFAVGRLV